MHAPSAGPTLRGCGAVWGHSAIAMFRWLTLPVRCRWQIAQTVGALHHGVMPTLRYLLIICAWFAMAPGAASPLFERDEVVEVELVGPINSLLASKNNRAEFPFVLRSGGEALDIDVRVRGKSRAELCGFPPLRLDFRRGRPQQGLFAGQDKLKLVTHCRDWERAETNAIEEFLAYRIFGLLSEVGYRVRLLRITYSDTEGRTDAGSQARFGFVIEPLDRLAERVSGVVLEIGGVVLGRLDPDQAALVYVFQYMIGNTDWSFVIAEQEVACCHNGDLLDIGGAIYYVPYDFDLAGIVNARYAKPLPEMRLRSVRQRRYRGFCSERETLRTAIRRVNARRSDIHEVIRSTPGLSAKGAEDIVDYLETYFERAEDEDKLLRSFERACIDG
jgi:hypothetical protein